jgi:hypothetical protein
MVQHSDLHFVPWYIVCNLHKPTHLHLDSIIKALMAGLLSMVQYQIQKLDHGFLQTHFYTPVFKTGRIMVYQCPTVRPFHMSRYNLRTLWPIHFKFHRVIGIDGLTVCILYGEFRIFIPELWDFIHQIVRDFKAIFRMSHCKLRTPLPIHFKLRIVIGIDSLMVCILFGEISIFHSRVMGLYSSNCRRFFVCHAVNWELLGQCTSNFA